MWRDHGGQVSVTPPLIPSFTGGLKEQWKPFQVASESDDDALFVYWRDALSFPFIHQHVLFCLHFKSCHSPVIVVLVLLTGSKCSPSFSSANMYQCFCWPLMQWPPETHEALLYFQRLSCGPIVAVKLTCTLCISQFQTAMACTTQQTDRAPQRAALQRVHEQRSNWHTLGPFRSPFSHGFAPLFTQASCQAKFFCYLFFYMMTTSLSDCLLLNTGGT